MPNPALLCKGKEGILCHLLLDFGHYCCGSTGIMVFSPNSGLQKAQAARTDDAGWKEQKLQLRLLGKPILYASLQHCPRNIHHPSKSLESSAHKWSLPDSVTDDTEFTP